MFVQNINIILLLVLFFLLNNIHTYLLGTGIKFLLAWFSQDVLHKENEWTREQHKKCQEIDNVIKKYLFKVYVVFCQ